jgi:hypothetical protein
MMATRGMPGVRAAQLLPGTGAVGAAGSSLTLNESMVTELASVGLTGRSSATNIIERCSFDWF